MFTLNQDKVEGSRSRRAKYVLKPGFLDAQRERATHFIPADNPVPTASHIKQRVQKGELQVLDIIDSDGRELGFVVYRIIEREDMKEFLVVCLQAKDGRRMMPELEQLAVRFAESKGCQSIRMHTMRHGLVESLVKAGWYVSEIVMRKTINTQKKC